MSQRESPLQEEQHQENSREERAGKIVEQRMGFNHGSFVAFEIFYSRAGVKDDNGFVRQYFSCAEQRL